MDDYFTNTNLQDMHKCVGTHNKTKEEQKDRGITFWTSETSPEKYAIDRKTDAHTKNKFYFILFRWKQIKEKHWKFCEVCIEKHPLEWLVEMRKKIDEENKYIGWDCKKQIYLISFHEIPFSIYKKYKDKIGYY